MTQFTLSKHMVLGTTLFQPNVFSGRLRYPGNFSYRLSQKIECFIILLLTFLVFSTVAYAGIPSESIAEASSRAVENKTNYLSYMPLVATILGGLVGALAACLFNIYFSKRQSKKELRSLILAFASELTLAFNRCVMYYEQAVEGSVSYSGLFDFTDASTLSKFATVNTNPEVVAAIMDLKSTYFQVSRHVDEAAKFATQAERITVGKHDKERFERAARHAQETALAFFLNSYKDIQKETDLVIKEAKRISPGKIVEELEIKFLTKTRKKAELDASRQKQDDQSGEQDKT